MTMLPSWQVTPLGVLMVLIGITHEVGIRNLAKRQTVAHEYRSRRRSLLVYAGLAGVVVVVSGPLERLSMTWLTIHMTVHLLEMFYLPPLIILGGAQVPLLHALPIRLRRRLLHTYYQTPQGKVVRRFISAGTSPVMSILIFNGVMVLWHIPRVYDWSSSNPWSMNWLMAPSFVLAGLLFWRIVLPSHPSAPRASPPIQLAAIAVTGLEMLVLAMSMAIFTKAPWYSMNVTTDGPVAALRDQRWAAGILWVCGDFWAVPALVLIAYRAYGGGKMSETFERSLGRVWEPHDPL